ncbi:conjugal transfer protein, partial [Ochrobactrum quorumnocens]
PTTRFARSVEEDARRAQLHSDRWREREAILRPVLEKIYRDPDRALARLNALASNRHTEPRRLAEDLATTPQRLGRLLGSDRLADGRAARGEHKQARAALSELSPLARAHATEFRR